VLFAGSANLRKGIPYLAEAARLIASRDPDFKFVVAGEVTETVRARPEAKFLQFLGPLNRERMAEEFARADVFCLPSLAEGSATVIFEALANSVPVVTTSLSGSVVADGIEGLIVPQRSGEAIADAVQRIVGNRKLRAQMSTAARLTAARYSDAACGARFIAVIREVLDARAKG
jgi:glycosyltransferase involved in cell wall biosynthesis